MVASPEEQLKGLEVGDRVEVRLEEQSVAGSPDSAPDRTVSGIIRKVDDGSKLLRIETTEGNIIDISPLNGLSSGMAAGERVQLAIHKK